MEAFREILVARYGIRTYKITRQKGGWSALAYRVDTSRGAYFLKAYPQSRASTPKLTAHLDDYLSVVAWLGKDPLEGRVVHPVATLDGKNSCADDENVYALFEYIEGETLEEREPPESEIRALAELTGDLHNIDASAPEASRLMQEDFSTPFCGDLLRFLARVPSPLPEDAGRIVLRDSKTIQDAAARLDELARTLRDAPPRYVLAHMDIRGANVMRGPDSLTLLDWEGIKRAPAEADLFLFWGCPR